MVMKNSHSSFWATEKAAIQSNSISSVILPYTMPKLSVLQNYIIPSLLDLLFFRSLIHKTPREVIKVSKPVIFIKLFYRINPNFANKNPMIRKALSTLALCITLTAGIAQTRNWLKSFSLQIFHPNHS